MEGAKTHADVLGVGPGASEAERGEFWAKLHQRLARFSHPRAPPQLVDRRNRATARINEAKSVADLSGLINGTAAGDADQDAAAVDGDAGSVAGAGVRSASGAGARQSAAAARREALRSLSSCPGWCGRPGVCTKAYSRGLAAQGCRP